jgi:hypothetical protein
MTLAVSELIKRFKTILLLVSLVSTGLVNSSCDLILQAAVRAAGGYPKDLTAFSFTAALNSGAGLKTDCVGAFAGNNIYVSLPYGSSVTALVATFTINGSEVRVGSTAQVSGVTPNNFTNPVTYVVVASDSTTKSYIVTVTVAANKDITAFKFEAALNSDAGLDSDCVGAISGTNISVTLYVTDVTALIATFTTTGVEVRVGSTVQASGVTPNDYTNPVTYVVVAADATTKSYTVTVTVKPWHIVGTAGFSASYSPYISLAVDSTGNPYVGYRDDGNGQKATVMKYASGSWQAVGGVGFSAGVVQMTSMKIGPSDTPHIAYRDDANGAKATVMKYVSGSWQVVGTTGFSAGSLDYLSLAIDSTGTPYVAYRDYANSNKATVMKYSEGSWQIVGTAGFSAGAVYFTSLAIDPTDTLYLAFRDEANGSKATVMNFTSGSWQVVGTAGFSEEMVEVPPSFAIDSTGIPYIGYRDHANNDQFTLMKYAAGSWQVVGTAGFGPTWAGYPSLAIDSMGTPYIAFSDPSSSNKATVMKYASGSWQVVGITGFSAGEVNNLSLAIDSFDTPFVAFNDFANNEKATVMRYK